MKGTLYGEIGEDTSEVTTEKAPEYIYVNIGSLFKEDWVKVEVVGKRTDFREDGGDITYLFMNPRTGKLTTCNRGYAYLP